MSIVGVPAGAERWKGAEKVFEKIMGKQLSELDEVHEYTYSRSSNNKILRGKHKCKFSWLWVCQ